MRSVPGTPSLHSSQINGTKNGGLRPLGSTAALTPLRKTRKGEEEEEDKEEDGAFEGTGSWRRILVLALRGPLQLAPAPL